MAGKQVGIGVNLPKYSLPLTANLHPPAGVERHLEIDAGGLAFGPKHHGASRSHRAAEGVETEPMWRCVLAHPPLVGVDARAHLSGLVPDRPDLRWALELGRFEIWLHSGCRSKWDA
jgi:hypothetical protein